MKMEENKKEVYIMPKLEMVIPAEDLEEIKEFVEILIVLKKEDRVILLSNANAFKVRDNLEMIQKIEKQ